MQLRPELYRMIARGCTYKVPMEKLSSSRGSIWSAESHSVGAVVRVKIEDESSVSDSDAILRFSQSRMVAKKDRH